MGDDSFNMEINDNPCYTEHANADNFQENSSYFTNEQNGRGNNAVEDNNPDVYINNDDDEDNGEGNAYTTGPLTCELFGKRLEFVFNTIGYVVGLGNIWRFSSLCYKYGGGVFIPVYTLFLIILGLPLFVLELYMGQFTTRGCIECWGNCRILKAFGVGSVVLTAAIMFTYGMFMVWSVKYLVLSFFNPLPWSNESIKAPCIPNCSFSAQIYFNTDGFHLNESTGIGNMGSPKWEIILAGFFIWAIIFLGLYKKLKLSGKIVYLTILYPYLAAMILLFHGITLNGSHRGLWDYMSTSDYAVHFVDDNLWIDAAIQICFSLSLGQGGLTCLASLNDFKSNFLVTALVTTLVDYCTSLLMGVVVFLYVGYVRYGLHLPFSGSRWDGMALLFVIVPQAISESNVASFWAVIFFLMLISLAYDVMLTFVRTIGIAIFEGLSAHRHFKELYINLGLCLFGFITTIALSTPGGVYLFNLVFHYGDSWTMLLNSLLAVVLTMILYGGVNITIDIAFMLKEETKTMKAWKYVQYYFLVCWYCLTPSALLYLLISKWIKLKIPLEVFGHTFPEWSIAIGWLIALCIPFSVLVTWLVYFIKAKGSLTERFNYMKNSQPNEPLWNIASEETMRALTKFKIKIMEDRKRTRT